MLGYALQVSMRFSLAGTADCGMFVSAVVVFVSIVGGIACSVYLLYRACENVPGFRTVLLFGILFAAAASMPPAYLIGGWGEELLGTSVGVPLGLFVGSLVGTAANCFVIGTVGAVVSWMRRTYFASMQRQRPKCDRDS